MCVIRKGEKLFFGVDLRLHVEKTEVASIRIDLLKENSALLNVRSRLSNLFDTFTF